MPKILILDSNSATVGDLQQTLSDAGFEALVASTGSDAIELLQRDPSVDLVLIDLDREDGLESARRITKARELPIVYRIGAFESNRFRGAREVSCYGMAPKDGDPQLLPEILTLAMDLYESHRQARRAYEEHNELLQSLSETVIAYDREGTVLFLNRQAALILGDDPKRIIGKSLFDLFPRENAERGIERIRYVFETGKRASSETSVQIKGRTHWFELRYQPVKGDDGVVERVLQIGIEVTERITSDVARRESEERYRLLAEHSSDVVAALDSKLAVSYVSPSVQELYGYSPAHLRRHGLFLAVHPQDLGALRAHITERIRGGSRTGVSEFRVICEDGTVKWGESRGRYMYDDSGHLLRIVVNIRDITERKLAEEVMRENEERYRLFAENASDAILVLNKEFGYDYISPSIEDLLGYTPEEIMELEPMHAVHPEDLEELNASIQRDMAKGVEDAVYVHREQTKSGEVKWVESRARYLFDEGNTMQRGVVVIRDVTERKLAEDALTEERDRVKQLLGYQQLLSDEIHHRVKNDMNFVKSLLSLQASQAKNTETEFSLREAARRITVVSKVYERLHRSGNFTVMSVKELVDELADSLKESTVPANGVLKVTTEDFVVPTREAVSLGIILNELITNAAKYAFDNTQSPVIRVTVTLREDNRVELTVEDNGSGFPESILRGEGFGYGLTIVEALVGQHDGDLRLGNGAGGCAEVELPFQL